MALLSPDGYLAHLQHAADDVAGVLAVGDLAAPVPGCAPWRLVHLAHHLGGVHRWATTAVVEGRQGPEAVDGAPTDRDELVAWFREGAATLGEALRRAGPAAPCWTFGPPPGTALFWFRRQAHETAVHAADAAVSQGTGRACCAELALDGVDEVVEVFVPRQVRLGRLAPLRAPIAFEAAEGGRWVLGAASERPVATVSGPAEALLMVLWRRTPLADPRLVVSGRRDVAGAVVASALTP